MFGPFKIQNKNDYLKVVLPCYLRDKNWADSMGLVQSEICRWASEKAGTPNNKVMFDFNRCRWIDPLPLMSILLEVANAYHLGMNVEVRLPKSDSGPKSSEIGPYQNSPNRLLLFLDQEGFLDCLDDLGDKVTYHTYKSGENRIHYKKLHVKLSYEDALCIGINLLNVPDEINYPAFAKDTVEKLLVGVDSKLESKVAPQTRERLIYKLRVALQEVLHNAQEHAYEKNTDYHPKTLYVRYRTGGLRLDTEGRKIYEKHVEEESKWCPRLAQDWLTVRPGCLEVFVLDRGIGMVRSFENAKIPLTETYKFREVIVKTFYDGLSAKKERQTRYGGLHLLYNLLSMTSDYLRALDDGVWCGRSIPILKKTMQHELTKDRALMQGLAFHFRLGWKEETDDGDKWAKFEEGKKSDVWPELSLHKDECKPSFDWFASKAVIDERFVSSEESVFDGQGDWILWLVRPHRMKWDIISYIERSISPRATGKTILIIADIPSYEAETYAAALAEYKENIEINWPSKFSWIILSTNRWRFAAVNYHKEGQRHGFSKLYEDFTSLKIPTPQIKPKPANFRLAIVRWLKWHDSRRLWDEVHERRTMFIPEKVLWGKDDAGEARIISGYLDFPQTTHNGLCVAIYRASLARVLGVLPPNKVEMYPLDRLTLTVLREIHAVEVYEPVENRPEDRLALGSVLVSGTTLDATLMISPDLHFFVHSSSPLVGSKPSLLYWQPKAPVSDNESRLARIGKTATIAPDGWKSFEVPRFDNQGICIGTRHPDKTYQDWQSHSPVIVKSGHWSYEGHHDFITVNIVSAVESAFLEKNELARFLVVNILSFIGLDKSHIDGKWHRLFEGESGNTTLSYDPMNYGLLVYRSHPSSESIIRKLLEVLTPAGREAALSRIFPVLPIRMRQSGSTLLIPPLIREEISKAVNDKNIIRRILLFDDAAITGRTLSDLRAALSAIGAKEIKTIVIANRLRQPADGYGEERLIYYWRLDLPLMGGGGNCPFCHALHLVEAFAHSLVTDNAQKEIAEWKQRWSEISPLDNWSGGLRPLPLIKIEQKEFCYRQNKMLANKKGKYLAKIDLIRSTGLAIYVSELHAMTGRDDHCLKKISEHSEPEVRIELAASQLLMFGNEFDLDIRVDLLQALLRELPKFKKDSPHASLAALVAIGGIGQLDKMTKLLVAKTVYEEGWVYRANYSTSVVLAYLVSEMLIDLKTDAYEIGKRLLSTDSWPLAQRLSDWFLEILSPNGNAHSEAIPILIDELTQSGSEIKVERVFDALDSLDHLDDIVTGLERGLVRKKELDKFDAKIVTMIAAAKKVKDLLAQKLTGEILNEWSENTKKTLDEYIESVKSLADAYFYRIPSAQNYFKERLFETSVLPEVIDRIDWKRASDRKSCDGKLVEARKRIVKISLAGEINFDSKSGEVWIVWHHGIYGIVLDLFRNAVYAVNQINDPWDSSQQDLADLWVKVDYEKEYVNLTLVNALANNSKDVFSQLKTHRWPYLRDFGGKVESGKVKSTIISQDLASICIRIPYAAYLRCEKEAL